MGRTDVLKTIKREIEELKKRRTECGNELGRASKVASKHNFSIFFLQLENICPRLQK